MLNFEQLEIFSAVGFGQAGQTSRTRVGSWPVLIQTWSLLERLAPGVWRLLRLCEQQRRQVWTVLSGTVEAVSRPQYVECRSTD